MSRIISLHVTALNAISAFIMTQGKLTAPIFCRTCYRPTLALLTLLTLVSTRAAAGPVAEAEVDGTAINNTRLTAQVIPSSAFTTPVPTNVFPNATNNSGLPQFPTATVSGRSGATDVDFFAFQAGAGLAYFDIDNAPSFDPVVSLFDSSGTLIGFGDDSSPADPGSTASFGDSFLGVFNLPSSGTYYITVSDLFTYPTVLVGNTPTRTSLLRPDGAGFGGAAISGVTAGDSSFTASGNQTGSPYTLHISLQNLSGASAAPEPGTLALLSLGTLLCGVMERRRKA